MSDKPTTTTDGKGAIQTLPPSPYNLKTYLGRVQHSLNLIDPRTLFTTSAQLAAYQGILTSYQRGEIGLSDEVWKAKKVVDATLHPDTGEKVILPFRMSAFVFSNLVVTAGMLTPGLSTRGVLGWQIANQTLNVCINYSNANKSRPTSYTQLGTSYLLAVSSSCGVALGLGKIVPKLKVSTNTKVLLGRLVPFAAVVSAGVVNVFAMRMGEIIHGVEVFPVDKETDEADSKPLGISRLAGVIAVGETAVSRVANAAPIMVVPPLVIVALQKRGMLKSSGRVALANLGLIFATSVFALPLALGVFPQRERVKAGVLEKEVVGRYEGLVEFNRGI